MLTTATATDSVENFKLKTAEYLKKVKETSETLVLTVDGKPEVVVQDAESYKKMIEAVDLLEEIEGIKRGLESFERGEGVDAKEALEGLRRKHEIPR